MIYKIQFEKKFVKSWNKLDSKIRNQFKKKLEKIKNNPEVPKNKLSGSKNKYKIKLKESGYRLIYEVKKEEILILVLKIGKREKEIYESI